MIIWVFLIHGYICMYTLRSFIWKQDTCCIKMRREHQHNSSCYPSENCQIYFVKYGHQNELGVSWALPEPKNSISSWDQGPGQGLRLISPSPSKFWLEQVKHEYWNTFRVLPWKILYRDALGCVLCTFPFLLLVSGNAPPFALPGETPTSAPAGQGNQGQHLCRASLLQARSRWGSWTLPAWIWGRRRQAGALKVAAHSCTQGGALGASTSSHSHSPPSPGSSFHCKLLNHSLMN